MQTSQNPKNRIKLFPNALLRIAGGSFKEFSKLNSKLVLNQYQATSELTDLKAELQQQLTDRLFQVVSELDDAEARKKVLKLKRKLSDGKEYTLDQYRDFLPENTFFQIKNYSQVCENLKLQWESADQIFKNEISELRSHFSQLVSKNNLQNGLLLSSQALLDYVRKNGNSYPKQPKKQERKAELSLLKYLGRIYTKTSPFSSFTLLDFVRIVKDGERRSHEENTLSDGKGLEPTSHVRLNVNLFNYISEFLMGHEELSNFLKVRKNPTVKKSNIDYFFLVNFGNYESFQSLEGNPFLDFLDDYLEENSNDGVIFENLVKTASETVVGSPDQVRSYLRGLIEFGYIEYNFKTRALNPDWDIELVDELAENQSKSGLFRKLIAILVQLRHLIQGYEKADTLNRYRILESIHDQVRCLQDLLCESEQKPTSIRSLPEGEKESNKEGKDRNGQAFQRHFRKKILLPKESLIFEDANVSTGLELEKKAVQSFCGKIQELAEFCSRLDMRQFEQIKMKLFFKSKYGAENKVDLLTFYEDYFKEFKKVDLNIQKGGNGSPTLESEPSQSEPEYNDPEFNPYPEINQIRNQNAEWLNHVVVAILSDVDFNGDEINISPKSFKRTKKSNLIGNSIAAFVQFIYNQESDEPMKGVLNVATPGYGKYYSRFLHLFENRITDELIDENRPEEDHLVFVENSDGSAFNANLHPPLMNKQIWMPGSMNSIGDENQIPVTELSVKLSDDSIVLFHEKTQNQIHVFDLGFQGQKGRSQLFQLLLAFNQYFSCPNFSPIVSMINEKAGNRSNHQFGRLYPRIVYDDQVILQRKGWQIKTESLPVKSQKESDWSYFYRVQKWREEIGLPDEIFVKLDPFRELAKEKETKIGADDYKPQYINFNNPFLINLLGKILAKAHIMVHFEEMLPNSKSLLESKGESFVSEFILQWNSTGAKDD